MVGYMIFDIEQYILTLRYQRKPPKGEKKKVLHVSVYAAVA